MRQNHFSSFHNSIGHFRNYIRPAIQNDIMEVIGETISPEEFELKYNSNLATAIGREHILFPFMNSIESMFTAGSVSVRRFQP